MSDAKILTFKAEWCGPCSTQEQHTEELREKHSNVTVEEIDIDDNMDKANEYSVRSVPTIVVEADGEVQAQLTGVSTPDEILAEVPE